MNKFLNSFGFALQGIKSAFKEEANFRFHLFAALSVIVAGCLFNISLWEWITIVLCIVIVFSAELFNTAIENICDLITEDQHPGIKKVKDVSAAAVLLLAFGVAVVGAIIFLPKILDSL